MAKISGFSEKSISNAIERTKPKAITGGVDAPLVIYGKDRSLPRKPDVIIFDEGKYTPKSVAVKEIMDLYAKTGQIVQTGSLSKFKVGDTAWVNSIITELTNQYGGISEDEVYDAEKYIIAEFKANHNSLHNLFVECYYWHFEIIQEDLAADYLIDYLSNQDLEMLGGYNSEFLQEVFPDFTETFEVLGQGCNYGAIGEVIFGIEDGISTLVNNLFSKYSTKQIIGENFNYYDGEALEFEYEGKKYYIVRQD